MGSSLSRPELDFRLQGSDTEFFTCCFPIFKLNVRAFILTPDKW